MKITQDSCIYQACADELELCLTQDQKISLSESPQVKSKIIVFIHQEQQKACFVTQEGKLISVQHDSSIQANRDAIGLWEQFELIHYQDNVYALKSWLGKFLTRNDQGLLEFSTQNIEQAIKLSFKAIYSPLDKSFFDKANQLLNSPNIKGFIFGNYLQESNRFKARVDYLLSRNEVIKVHIGTGLIPKADFLNIEISVLPKVISSGWVINNYNSIYQFPANICWEIPDNSVDFIFHEDVIEHMDQLQQIEFLAEAYRVLKPDGVHRINTPCLAESMRLHSDFTLGVKGVYEGEWLRWGHRVVLTKKMIEEYASIVGYEAVNFTQKNVSLSPLHPGDMRPGKDRHDIYGNVYAELLKRK